LIAIEPLHPIISSNTLPSILSKIFFIAFEGKIAQKKSLLGCNVPRVLLPSDTTVGCNQGSEWCIEHMELRELGSHCQDESISSATIGEHFQLRVIPEE
jgi:hypothetical protein